MKWWQVVGAAVLALGAIALFLWLRAKGDKRGASHAMADAIDAWYGPRLVERQVAYEGLKKQLASDSDVLRAAEQAVVDERGKLSQKYATAGLTATEVSQRLSGLRI